MIRIQSDGGVDRRNTPIFVCDICSEPITDITNGTAVFRDHGHGEGELHTVLHAHKGRCHDQAEAQMVGQSGGPWHELQDHLNAVVAGMGVTIRGMIGREVAWSCALTPDQENELQERISVLEEWLREHGVASPLWG